MHVVVLRASGRHVQSPIDGLLDSPERPCFARPRVLFIVTHVDKRYQTMLEDQLEKMKAQGVAKSELRRNKGLRQSIADEVKRDDAIAVAGCKYVYSCFGGPAAGLFQVPEPMDARDEYLDELPRILDFMCDDLKEFFDIKSEGEIREEIHRFTSIDFFGAE